MNQFKIFAWQSSGYWCGQKLVPVSAIRTLKNQLSDCPTFASIQTYDQHGKTMYCPLYADLDGKDPKQAHFDAQYIVSLVGEMTNIVPDIYYSGNKGYHVIIPYRIEHEQCHLVAKHFFEYLAEDIPTLDGRVYRSQSLLRLPGSPASRPGYFKVQITKKELMSLSHDSITDLAKAPRIGDINEFDHEKLNQDFFDVIEAGKSKVPVYRNQQLAEYISDIGQEMTPCLKKMLENPSPTGKRNQTVYLLARLFKKCGLAEQDALSLLTTHTHWLDYEKEERGVSKVLSSLYKSPKQVMIGCRMGQDAELMKAHCDQLCWFNEDFIFGWDFQNKHRNGEISA